MDLLFLPYFVTHLSSRVGSHSAIGSTDPLFPKVHMCIWGREAKKSVSSADLWLNVYFAL